MNKKIRILFIFCIMINSSQLMVASNLPTKRPLNSETKNIKDINRLFKEEDRAQNYSINRNNQQNDEVITDCCPCELTWYIFCWPCAIIYCCYKIQKENYRVRLQTEERQRIKTEESGKTISER